MSDKLEKEDLLNILVEKKIISSNEDFDNLSKPQLEKLLNCGLDLIIKSIETEEANQVVIEQIKNTLLEDKDAFNKTIIVENKRLTQKMNKLEEDCKTKLKEFAKLFDKEKLPRSKG